jgi:hypothetical protein
MRRKLVTPLLDLPSFLLDAERERVGEREEFTGQVFYHGDTVNDLLEDKVQYAKGAQDVTVGLTLPVDSPELMFDKTDHQPPHRYASVIQVGGGHFIGCILQSDVSDRRQIEYTLTIIDPLRQEVRLDPADYPRTDEVLTLFCNNFPDIELATVDVRCNPPGMVHQTDVVSCGAAAVESLDCLLTGKDPRTIPGVSIENGVAVLEKGAEELRLQHAETLANRAAWNQFNRMQGPESELSHLIQNIITKNTPREALDILCDMGALGKKLTPQEIEGGDLKNVLFIGDKCFKCNPVRDMFEAQSAAMDSAKERAHDVPNGTQIRPDPSPDGPSAVRSRL